MNGVVKNIAIEKGYCFIKGEDGKEYFAHRSAFKNIDFQSVEAGQEVTFEDSEGAKGLRAEDVFAV